MKKAPITILMALILSVSSLFSQVQVDKFTGDVSYGLPLLTIPNFRGPSVSTSISYRSDIKVDQTASEVGLGWNINAGGSVERIVNGVPDDWNTVFVPDMQAASFQNHLGALYLHTPSSNTVLDFDYTRYKMDTLNDTLKYYYPNYDTYFVTGAGMAGKIMPANYDYASVVIDTTTVNRWFYNKWYSTSLGQWITDSVSIGIKEIETYSIDGDNPFNFKTHFQYEHNLYDEVDSKAFPWDESPINSSTTIIIPEDTAVSNYYSYNGAGYNNEDYTVIANKNRTRTSNYIEYFTNEEIYNDSVSNFIEYDTLFNRSVEADFPQKGIGAYRITDPNGYTYHYSLPVYAHYNSSGNYSLDKDYNVKILEGGSMDITDSTHGYIVENEFTHEILEIKQVKKYAIRWLLTAITGPDFEDSNSNGIVDEADKGYWVNYNYELWTETFPDRFPYYGSRYSFGAGIEENIKSKFLSEADSMKMTGKMLSYSTSAEQVYYLNQIQTPSHTGIFCRDLRYDEQSQPFIYNQSGVSPTVINNAVDSVYLTDQLGDARLTSPDDTAQFSHTLLIEPSGYASTFDVIDVEFRLLNCNLINEYTLTVYDGATTSDPILLDRENDDNLGDYPGSEGGNYSFVATSGKILVKFNIDTAYYDAMKGTFDKMTYDIDWSTRWDNALPGWPEGRQKTVPSLKLSQLFLFDNNDLDSLPVISAMDTLLNDKLWDYSNVNRSVFYNSDWYETNKTKVDSLALQSIKLDQDYSLAKEYHNNRFVIVTPTTISSTPIEVENNKYTDTSNIEMSGKLTLNKVIYYGLNRTQTQPSHLFDYNANDTTDNPDYNHLMQDYWGNYKSDGDSNLLRGYVTANSAARTAAWSLRTVTSPLGGTTEIIYESDEYEQVLSEELGGTLRGPIKTFALKNVNAVKDGSGNVGADWTFEVENQESEFWNLKNNLPYGAAIKTVIPAVWIYPKTTGYEYYEDLFNDLYNYSGVLAYGTGTFTTSPNKVSAIARCYETNLYDTTSVLTSLVFNANFDSLSYSGGGLVEFQYPIGEKIKGGGTRVKELKVSNGTDIYTVAYSYDEGTATIEAGDFSKQRTKIGREDGIALGRKFLYDYALTSNSYNPFGMSPQVGYGKVTIENKGQASTGQGKSVFDFHVSNEGKTYFEHYQARMDSTWVKIGSSCGFMGSDGDRTNKRHAIEIVDDFTSIWGKIKEQKLQDINGITISKKVYEYEKSTKGAHVSAVNYLIDEQTGCDDTLTYLSCIKRSYPTYLKKVITYSNGRKSESEIVYRDPFTGDPTGTKNTSVNGTETSEYIVLAYTQNFSAPDYSELGAKSVDPSYHNYLNATYSSRNYKKSEGIENSDFLSHGKSFWKDSVTTRYYDASTDVYTTLYDQVNWFDYTKYAWTGALGSSGLYDTTGVTDITEPPTEESDWRFITEITLMDEEQNVLEQKGFNDRFSASKLGYDNRFTYTSGSNTNYVSFTATGFETKTEVEAGKIYYEGEVLSQSNTQITSDGSVYPHTGNYMVNISAANSVGPIYKVNYDSVAGIQSLQRGRTYTASVWVHKNSPLDTKLNIDIEGYSQSSSYSVSDTMSISNTNSIQIGDWIQLTVNIDVPSDFTCPTAGDGIKVYVDKSTYTPAWIDDMMFHSRVTGSGMNVYDQRTGRVMATLSDNNFATKYVYNDAGQVIEVWKEVLGDTWGKWVKVESRDFNFQRAME